MDIFYSPQITFQRTWPRKNTALFCLQIFLLLKKKTHSSKVNYFQSKSYALCYSKFKFLLENRGWIFLVGKLSLPSKRK
jgi:hypothetical protein